MTPPGRPRPEALYASPNALAVDYTRFRVSERILLTGHSHQAWPDVAFRGQQQAWLEAAEHVDDKWSRVLAMCDRVTEGFRALMGGAPGHFTLDANTHALVVRFLSALPLRERPRVVTTDGEFHSVRRQLDRLEEEGIEVVRVSAARPDEVAERLARQVDDRTAAVIVSSVLFETGLRVPGLPRVAEACRRAGAHLLIDAYHSLNVVPFSLEGMEDAFVVAGGYKYCQLGEGNCVLRVPEGCALRPVVTGWFSEFHLLEEDRSPAGGAPRRVPYGPGPWRFGGSTFDPTSSYRAAAVFDFFRERGLTPAFLREVNQHQIQVLIDAFLARDLDPQVVRLDAEVPLEARGGFLALHAPRAGALSRALRARGVWTDARGNRLRFGPAPYVSDRQLTDAMEALGEVVREGVPGPDEG